MPENSFQGSPVTPVRHWPGGCSTAAPDRVRALCKTSSRERSQPGTNADQYIGRIDHSLSERHRLFFRYPAMQRSRSLNEQHEPIQRLHGQPVADRNLVGEGYTASPLLLGQSLIFAFGRQFTIDRFGELFCCGSRALPADAGTKSESPATPRTRATPASPR